MPEPLPVLSVTAKCEEDLPDPDGGIRSYGRSGIRCISGCLQHLWQSDQHRDFCSGGSGGLFCPSDPVEGCGRPGTEKYAWRDQTVRIGKKTASDEIDAMELLQISLK